MANTRIGNKIYVDATGSLADSKIKVAGILFTPDATNDQLVLGESVSSSPCISLRSATAKTTLYFDFSSVPALFVNGLYVQTITSGATATIITTEAGK